MKKTIYVVSYRYGTQLCEPTVHPTEKEADKVARECVLEAAKEAYVDDTGESGNVRTSTIQRWADENGYDLSDYYFWDGGYDATEVNVTKHEIDI